MNPSENNGGPKGQHALSPGQRPGFLIRPHYSAPTGQKPYNQSLIPILQLKKNIS